MNKQIRRFLGAALKQMLVEATGRPIGLMSVPTEHPEMPYAVLFPMNTIPREEDWSDPEGQFRYMFQLSCVGGTHEQVTAMSERGMEALIARNPNGSFVTPLVIEGITIINRKLDQLGVIVASGTGRIYTSPDAYSIEVM